MRAQGPYFSAKYAPAQLCPSGKARRREILRLRRAGRQGSEERSSVRVSGDRVRPARMRLGSRCYWGRGRKSTEGGKSCFSKGVAKTACKQRPYKATRGPILSVDLLVPYKCKKDLALVDIDVEYFLAHSNLT